MEAFWSKTGRYFLFICLFFFQEGLQGSPQQVRLFPFFIPSLPQVTQYSLFFLSQLSFLQVVGTSANRPWRGWHYLWHGILVYVECFERTNTIFSVPVCSNHSTWAAIFLYGMFHLMMDIPYNMSALLRSAICRPYDSHKVFTLCGDHMDISGPVTMPLEPHQPALVMH